MAFVSENEATGRALVARVSSSGLLRTADPPLLRLIISAGGQLGSEIPIPQLAALVRLVRQQGQGICQDVIIGDGPDVRLVTAQVDPEDEGICLVILGWDNRLGPPEILAQDDVEFDFARLRSDGAWRTDKDLVIQRMAAGVDVDWGFLPATARGQPFSRIFRLMPDATGDVPFLAALANGAAFEAQPAEFIASKNAPILLSGKPLTAPGGGFAGLSGQIRFLKHEKTTSPEPQALSDLDMVLSRYLEPALRVPIAHIVDEADALALQVDGPLRQDYVRYAEDIAGAARHFLGLVDDLANLNAIDQPGFSIETGPIDIGEVARRAPGLLAVRRMDRGLTITLPHQPLLVAGEFGRVLQILVNLLANAIRHSPEGGHIWLEPVSEPGKLGLAVVDQGGGIAAEDHERVFGKFERLGDNAGGGSGLGLYISRKLARAMGGDIRLESRSGEGARFILMLQAI